MRLLRSFCLILVLALSATSQAQTFIAYDVPAGPVSNQNISNPLGLDFDVLVPVTLLSLGVFDSGQDGLAFDHVLYIYDRDTEQAVATVTVPSGVGAPLAGGSRFVNLSSPVALSAGFRGSIVAEVNPTDGNWNSNGGGGLSTLNDGGGLIAFVGGGRVGDFGPGLYPTRLDGGPVNRYLAGTFTFTPVPEPSVVALLLGGLGLGWLIGRRRGSA